MFPYDCLLSCVSHDSIYTISISGTLVIIKKKTVSDICKYYLTHVSHIFLYLFLFFAVLILTIQKPVVWLVITSVSPTTSVHAVLMKACNIVLIFTLLFSIKGQTVQNSTVIPPHFMFALHPSVFILCYDVNTTNCTRFASDLSIQELQVQRLLPIHSDFLCLYFSVTLTIPLSLHFLPKTANQKAAS